MGVDYNVYIGPYIKCINHKVESVEEATCCPHCGKDMTSQFCPRCGTAQAVRQYTVNDWAVDDQELCEAFEEVGKEFYDVLCYLDIDGSDEGEVFFTCNSTHSPGISFDPKHEFGIIANEINAAEDRAKMLEFSSEALAVLRKLYGEDKVSVEWGVISYAN